MIYVHRSCKSHRKPRGASSQVSHPTGTCSLSATRNKSKALPSLHAQAQTRGRRRGQSERADFHRGDLWTMEAKSTGLSASVVERNNGVRSTRASCRKALDGLKQSRSCQAKRVGMLVCDWLKLIITKDLIWTLVFSNLASQGQPMHVLSVPLF